jgi:hypothetical protein
MLFPYTDIGRTPSKARFTLDLSGASEPPTIAPRSRAAGGHHTAERSGAGQGF